VTGAAPLLWTLPWIVPPAIALARARHSRSLTDYSAEPPDDPPFVSVIVPARNERRNIERCVSSVLSAHYPAFEVIVVDAHSSDGTGDAARAVAAHDPRVRVIQAPDLEPGWFGKQWACAAGARDARGTLLLFTDADTRHASDLLARAVNALRTRGADMLSVAGRQEMHTFWERVIQPQVFAMLSTRYGGMEHVSRTRRWRNVIANGQFILVRRDSYDEMGGHALVRDRVAEDLSLAQEWVRAGKRLTLLLGIEQLSTHMYASLAELIAGWRKNIFAGGRHAMPGGAVGRALFPLLLIGVPLFGLAPVVVLPLGALGVLAQSWLLWSAVCVLFAVAYWAVIYRYMGERAWYALAYPLGLVMLFYISAGAVLRGRRVEWKARSYLSS
jgi:chlorobactene glucosyltransferase